MSTDVSGLQTPHRRRSGVQGLKVHTLPTDPDDAKQSGSAVRTSQSQGYEDAQIDDEYAKAKPQSSFEMDEDFKFKRRRRKDEALGERLESLQEMQQARWVENFNSSMQQAPPVVPSQYGQLAPPNMMAPPQYMPYMYYYPMPAPMVPIPTSPQRPGEMPSSMQGYPNTSTQPFFPHLGPMMGGGQVVPQQGMYPGYYSQEARDMSRARDPQQSRDRRKTIMSQRGRRLSMLSLQGDERAVDAMRSEIVSPHKDVPETDFYRHIANTSFGRGLQTRQLFNWCFIRCLRKYEENIGTMSAGNDAADYTSPKRISMMILKEFVQDLRKGKLEMDWDGKSIPEGDEQGDVTEDTVLRELFDEDEHHGARSSPTRRKRKAMLIPNEKNIQNMENIKVLEEKIAELRDEISQWSVELDKEEHQTAATVLETVPQSRDVEIDALPAVPIVPNFKMQFCQSMDRLLGSSHLLAAHAQLLSKTLALKSGKIAKRISNRKRIGKSHASKAAIKNLLVGLSSTMAPADS
ncbi:AGR247Cp [Eremothecium gossypii ATCC 10895]|uniref:AGR247Cp n=1 Tax=Eremothecium gossypii (strain ATCC 10895 / CBS 109.51 / FGSC 9923 / NRRL Y-1056) TaxID=284811 RepID=Q74ZF2_EREGS|nr:AGR247Cp [Eremothecium gossypii ATCC 10895]AAS54737.1 AGR247Cp [Eremothecium gossypii ATCC 10895]AEY99068.1 FAGR247Cp [Eremothecium gossypii FDAG1]